jgi:hypothetical protein
LPADGSLLAGSYRRPRSSALPLPAPPSFDRRRQQRSRSRASVRLDRDMIRHDGRFTGGRDVAEVNGVSREILPD